jgi:hypothetical protein
LLAYRALPNEFAPKAYSIDWCCIVPVCRCIFGSSCVVRGVMAACELFT